MEATVSSCNSCWVSAGMPGHAQNAMKYIPSMGWVELMY